MKSNQPKSTTPASTTDEAGNRIAGDFRLGRVLRERLHQERSYLKLEIAIDEAVEATRQTLPDADHETIRGVDRRKLKRIVEGDPTVVIALAELRGLDSYLSRFAESLAVKPLFEHPHIIELLAHSGDVTFLLGSRPEPDDSFRINVGHSDVAGMNSIQQAIYGYGRVVRMDFTEIRTSEPPDVEKDLIELAYVDTLMEEGRNSIVCLGSGRANPATEAMLCEMFSLPTYGVPRKDKKAVRPPPFHFCWSPGHSNLLPSHLHMNAEEVTEKDPESGYEMQEHSAAAFEAGGRIILDEMTLKSQRPTGAMTFGLCAAQKRASGRIWLVVAGLTGPATEACSRWIRRMATDIHMYPDGKQSPVFWCFVQANARAEEIDGKITDYIVTGEEMCGELEKWPRSGDAP
jgi:hypothetical protein